MTQLQKKKYHNFKIKLQQNLVQLNPQLATLM
jgi:hypothetical protein